MTIEKNLNGSIVISDIINNEYITRVYYFYSVKEAKKMFKAEINEMK